MSNLQQFVNERLSAVALEIWGAVEKTLNEFREEICYSKEENLRLQQLLLDMEIKHQSALQQITLPEHPQIKEEPEMQTSWWEEQLPGQSHLYQTVESREDHSQPGQIKTETGGQAHGVSEPASDCHPPSVVTPNCTTAQTSEEGESGGLLPELLNPIKSKSTQTMKKQNDLSPIDSRETSEMRLTIEVLPGTKKPFQCPESSKYYTSNHSLQRQNHTETLPYHDQECGKDLQINSNLTVHMSSHTGDRPHQWQDYGKGFKPCHNLGVHLSHHTGEKPYQCQDCGKGFSQKRYMLGHMKTHAKVKPHHCQVCGKGFITIRDVRVHMRIHTGEKPYKCRECRKCFNHIGNLHVHMRSHTGEKPYWCQECGKSFRQKGHLDAHNMRVHIGETI